VPVLEVELALRLYRGFEKSMRCTCLDGVRRSQGSCGLDLSIDILRDVNSAVKQVLLKVTILQAVARIP
jgi:hypothetical protein